VLTQFSSPSSEANRYCYRIRSDEFVFEYGFALVLSVLVLFHSSLQCKICFMIVLPLSTGFGIPRMNRPFAIQVYRSYEAAIDPASASDTIRQW
jgi:hypothetical protein